MSQGLDYIRRAYAGNPTAAPPGLQHHADAEALRVAADVIMRRSRKRTFTRDLIVKVLRDQAAKLDAKERL